MSGESASNNRRVVVIEGDDASPEAVRPTVELIDSLGLGIEWVTVDIPPDTPRGVLLPHVAAAIDDSDATLFGSTSGASSGALHHLRWGCGTYANVRPARWRPGSASPLVEPEGIDFVIVRENLEDLYLGIEGETGELAPLGLHSKRLGRGPHEVADARYAIKMISRAGSERIIRFAFELARRRKADGYRGRVTLSSKYNMLAVTDGLFRDVGDALAPEYPDIEYERYIVDDFARRIVATPKELDVVVLPNLYGDILSDLAAGVVGGLGVAPSGVYGDDYAYFESAHGSAPDIAGRNIINPTATILSAAMMLDHLGFGDAGHRVREAIDAVYREGESLTPDMGGDASTTAFRDAVARYLGS